jgi:hypothetical protein
MLKELHQDTSWSGLGTKQQVEGAAPLLNLSRPCQTTSRAAPALYLNKHARRRHGLFDREAVGKAVTDQQIVANPHNQTLYFAIEWGVIGAILLYTMWITHFLMFTEKRWISWLGIIVVSQNILGSLFNAHLSDYVEGWIYVMGVGVAGGMISKLPKSSAILDDALTGSDPGCSGRLLIRVKG